MKLTRHEIATIDGYLQDKPVIRAYVFGTYARGEADELSDLDLQLELDYSQPIGIQFISSLTLRCALPASNNLK